MIFTNIPSQKLDSEAPLEMFTWQEFCHRCSYEVGWGVFLQSNTLLEVLQDDDSVMVLKDST